MAYEEGSASSVQDFCTKIKTFLVANGWTLIRDNTYGIAMKEYILKSSEYRGKYFYLGLRSFSSSDDHTYTMYNCSNGVVANVYTDYTGGNFLGNTNPAYTNSSYMTGVYAKPTSNGTTNPSISSYFLYTDGKFLFTKTEGWSGYHPAFLQCSYFGFFKPYATALEYEYPLVCLGVKENQISGYWGLISPLYMHTAETLFSNPDASKTFFYDNSWINNAFIYQNGSGGICLTNGKYSHYLYNKNTYIRNGDLVLRKIILFKRVNSSITNGTFGELPNSIIYCNHHLETGDIISVSGIQYYSFHNGWSPEYPICVKRV